MKHFRSMNMERYYQQQIHWLRKLVRDISMAQELGAIGPLPGDLRQLHEVDNFARDLRLVRSYRTHTAEDNRIAAPIEGPRLPCPECERTCKHARAVALHRTQTHGDRRRDRMLRTSNQCSWCGAIFTSAANVRRHVLMRDSALARPINRRHSYAELHVPSHFCMPMLLVARIHVE